MKEGDIIDYNGQKVRITNITRTEVNVSYRHNRTLWGIAAGVFFASALASYAIGMLSHNFNTTAMAFCVMIPCLVSAIICMKRSLR